MSNLISKHFRPGIKWLLHNLPIHSPYGKKALKCLLSRDSVELCQLQKSLHELQLLVNLLSVDKDFFSNASTIFLSLRDINGTFTNLENGSVLDETELFEVKTFALQINRLLELYQSTGSVLSDFVIHNLSGLVRLLNPDQLVTDSFYIHEAYSDDLLTIRREKRALEQRILQTTDVAQKETLRIERSHLVAEEKQEEFKVRSHLSEELRKWLGKLNENAASAGYLELMIGKAAIALQWPSCLPEVFPVEKASAVLIEDAINPEISEMLSCQGKKFTPVSLELNRGITILTGANMGGKTVALMTIAMNAELVKMGFFAFAKRFSMPLFDSICFVGGDEQSQVAGLSSFGAEIIRLSEVAELINRQHVLAIFDEFARSTNPYEGSRFVQALCEFIQQQKAYGIVATHYDGIILEDASYYQVVGLKEHEECQEDLSASDRSKVLSRLCANMDYRLKKVSGSYHVPKDALHIARLLETNKEFLGILKKYYD